MHTLTELEKILVCPKCRNPLIISEDEKWFICGNCALKYPIDNEIPVLLIDNAVPVEKINVE